MLLVLFKDILHQLVVALADSFGPVLSKLTLVCDKILHILLLQWRSASAFFLFKAIGKHVLHKVHSWTELKYVFIVNLHPFTQLVIVREGIISLLTTPGKVDLAHGEVVLVAVLEACALLGQGYLG